MFKRVNVARKSESKSEVCHLISDKEYFDQKKESKKNISCGLSVLFIEIALFFAEKENY